MNLLSTLGSLNLKLLISKEKHRLYSFETKLKAVFMKQEGHPLQTIQQKFHISHKAQIRRWIKCFNQKEFHRLNLHSG
ncbi:helix-turn-helix domain-containing protein, partial ['Cynodon dactylon' phytoplasma]|uniref:helix-turn-helix domain-containing protein n=1 Tax='Cynodon dactylon' phytoplasma TaxID=295320 RepID=UPI001265D2F2